MASNDRTPAVNPLFTPPAGAEERSPAEFWKPDAEGDTVVGKIIAFGEKRIGDDLVKSVELSPAALLKSNGTAAVFDSLKVGVNTALADRINERDKGFAFAFQYTGMEKTPAGKMRTYKVFQLTDDALAAYIARAEEAQTKGRASAGDTVPF